jgi:predicted transcriptional regulator of viral defense system
MPEKAESKTEAGTIGTEQTAKLLDITAEWLRRLTVQGYIPKAKRGRYNLVEAVQGYIRFLRDEGKRTSKSAQLTRMQDAKAEEIMMRVAEKRRELIPVEDAQAALDIAMAKLREELAGLPARMTRDMDLRRRLEAETNASLNRIADAFVASAKYFREGGDLPSGSGSDDA